MTDQEIIEAEVVEQARNLPAVRATEAIVARGELTVQELVAQAGKIQEVMSAAMKEGVHYGKIPGVNKPTLLKPGAETLNVLLRLAPSYDSDKVFGEGGHLTVVSRCTLTHIPTGMVIAQGEGLCSTRESKYAYRQGKRRCPKCGAEAIVRSTKKSAYFCISNEGGCGARFGFTSGEARELDGQDTTRVDNPDLPDTWNTVLKMADKRALVAAVLNGTAASDVFTQDVEDAGTTAAAPEETEERAFDPSRDLLPGAIQGDDFFARIAQALQAIDPSIDWKVTLDPVRPEPMDDVFYRRLSNAVARLGDLESFPPPDDAAIQEAFAEMFDGVVVEIHRKAEDELDAEAEAATQEDAPISSQIPLPSDEDDVPFGETDASAER